MSPAICRKGTCAAAAAAAAASLPAVDCSLVEYLLFCEAANEEQLLPVTCSASICVSATSRIKFLLQTLRVLKSQL